MPECECCEGILKPDFVFFGDNLPPRKAALAASMVAECDTMLILSTTVSAIFVFRRVLQIHASKKGLAAVKVGDLRAECMLDFKTNALGGDAMMRLVC